MTWNLVEWCSVPWSGSLFEMATLSQCSHFLISYGRGCCRSLNVLHNHRTDAYHQLKSFRGKIYKKHFFISMRNIPHWTVDEVTALCFDLTRFVTDQFSVGLWGYVISTGEMIRLTQSHDILRVTGPLCGEFTGHWWTPLTKASHAEFWCFLWPASE